MSLSLGPPDTDFSPLGPMSDLEPTKVGFILNAEAPHLR